MAPISPGANKDLLIRRNPSNRLTNPIYLENSGYNMLQPIY